MTTDGWRGKVVRLGHRRAVAMITLFSVLSSVAMTAALVLLFNLARDEVLRALLISAFVPAVVAPMASHLMVQLLFELEMARTRLLRIATRDDLTQAFNRGYFMDRLTMETRRSHRTSEPLSLLMIDVDEFKAINDRFGHPAGDRVLQEIARVAGGALRVYDVFARHGGEEFVALLPGAALKEAYLVAERIRSAVALLRVDASPGTSVSVTVSVGVSSLEPDDFDGRKLLDHADALLYEAKRAGRNRVAYK